MTKVAIALALMATSRVASADKVDDYIRKEMARQRIPGLSLAIVRNGKIMKSAGYGIADLDNAVKVRAETVFEVASITKQFTASLIMMLVQDGKLKLDDKVITILKDAPEKWKDVTVRHLLNHTGGMPALGKGFPGISKLRDATTDEMYAAVKSDEFTGTPGQVHAYSDVGYFLLGMIIEKATGQRYQNVLEDRILRPLKMDASRMQDFLRPYKGLAKGYTLYTGPEVGGVPTVVNIRRVAQRGLTSHYGLFSNVLDLAKWDATLHTEALLTPESKKQMWTAARLTDGATYDYGFGWYLGNRGGHRYTFHSGITGTGILRFPELKLSVIVLTNLGGWADGTSHGADTEKIVKNLATLVEPRLNHSVLADPAPATTARARTAFEALAKGNILKECFTSEGVETMNKYMADTLSAIKPLGEVRKFDLVEVTRKGAARETRLYRVTGSKAKEMFAFEIDPSGLIMDVYPKG